MEFLEACFDITKALKCPLCQNLFKDAVSFPACGHVFCRPCVLATLEGPGVVQSRCPTCTMPGWKNDLETNHLISSIADQFTVLVASLPGPYSPQTKLSLLLSRSQKEAREPCPKRQKASKAPCRSVAVDQDSQSEEKMQADPQLQAGQPPTSEHGGSDFLARHPSLQQDPPLRSLNPGQEERPACPSFCERKDVPGSPNEQLLLSVRNTNSMSVEWSKKTETDMGTGEPIPRNPRTHASVPPKDPEEEPYTMMRSRGPNFTDRTPEFPHTTSLDEGNGCPLTPCHSLAPDPNEFDIDTYVRERRVPEARHEWDELEREIAALEQALLLCDELPVTVGHGSESGTVAESIRDEVFESSMQQQTQPLVASFPTVHILVPDSEGKARGSDGCCAVLSLPGEQAEDSLVVPETQPEEGAAPREIKRLVISGSMVGVQGRVLKLQEMLGSDVFIVEDAVHQETTHVLVETNEEGFALGRTAKFLGGLAVGCWLVSHQWVDACLEARSCVPEDQFEVKGLAQPLYKSVSMGIPAASRQRAARGLPGIFDGTTFYVAKGLSRHKSDLRQPIPLLIELSGGIVTKSLGKTASMEIKVIVLEKDVASRMKQAHRDRDIISSKWILDSLTQGKVLPLSDYIDWWS